MWLCISRAVSTFQSACWVSNCSDYTLPGLRAQGSSCIMHLLCTACVRTTFRDDFISWMCTTCRYVSVFLFTYHVSECLRNQSSWCKVLNTITLFLCVFSVCVCVCFRLWGPTLVPLECFDFWFRVWQEIGRGVTQQALVKDSSFTNRCLADSV